MRFTLLTPLFGMALSLAARAQLPCSTSALPEAAKAVAATRHQLHSVAVGELDPAVPAPVAVQLGRLKDQLTEAAQATMSCAGPAATPEALQNTLANALHANLSGDSETVLVTPAHKDVGAYGSDLDVQVLPLSNAPRYLELNFRFGVECGDDNLLLVYKQADGGWQQILRWDAPAYHQISDAFGDFVLLTPLTGFPGKENWRAVVVHGRPGCSTTETRSRFDLDILEPGTDPAHPTVAWHMDQPYRRGDTPRLATTEDTLTLQLLPPAPEPAKTPAKGRTPASPFPAQIYRYRVSKENQVQPIEAAPDSVPSSSATSPGTSTSSPQ